MIDPRGEPWGLAHVLIAVKDGESDVDAQARRVRHGQDRTLRVEQRALSRVDLPCADQRRSA